MRISVKFSDFLAVLAFKTLTFSSDNSDAKNIVKYFRKKSSRVKYLEKMMQVTRFIPR